jgi:poly(3-hydroxybutyrate) depolymerase
MLSASVVAAGTGRAGPGVRVVIRWVSEGRSARMVEYGGGEPTPTAEQVAQAGTSYDWLTGVDGVLHWVESAPQTGRAVMVAWHPSEGSQTRTSGIVDASVGSGLHAYGGMPYAVPPEVEPVLVNASTGKISGGPVAPSEIGHCYGDLAWCDGELLCVREGADGDELVAADLTAAAYRVLFATDGFFASPRGYRGRLAWVQWGKDVMPWDSSEVWIADYTPGGQIEKARRVAGGPGESAIQPQWGQDGDLYFLSDRTGWWNLYRWRAGRAEALAAMDAECATAPWESSYANYVLLPGGRVGMTVQRGPTHELVVVEPDGHVRPVGLPYTSIKPHLAAVHERIALIGSSPVRAQEIALVATDGSDRVEVARPGSDGGQVSVPEVMRVESAGARLTMLFYPPAGGGGPAPVIVRPHAGPTYNSELRLDWEVQFFTSRGFAVAEVDYRGSTGYGRAFRKALDGHWGRLDVEDCRNAAVHLLAVGRALPGAVFISGASAGGYTALQAVCEDGPFVLAVARSAIVDAKRWMTTAPRFQQPHAAILAHDGARVAPERVRRPVLLIHGDEDAVAPIDDVLDLAEALDDRKLLVRMLKLDGIGHYVSTPAALVAALEAELAAYRGVITGR